MTEETKPIKITVFGSGSFGTALGYLLGKNGHKVVVLSRNPKVVESINKDHVNCQYVSDFKLPSTITATTDDVEALKDTNYILHCVPVQQSEEFFKKKKNLIPGNVPIISASKGIHTESLLTMNDIIPLALERVDQPLVFFSGPTFAKELLSDEISGTVIACVDQDLATKVAKLFSSKTLRAYTSTDVIGVEVAGALKNVFAIAAGMSTSLKSGMNSKAMLVTRGCSEMTKIAVAMGARQQTLSGLAGIGDLMLTCYGNLSRNQTVGRRLGEGEKLQDILDSMGEVAEGVATTPAAAKLAEKYGIDVPIIRHMDKVLKGELSPQQAVESLMSLPTGPEIDYVVRF